MTPVRPHRFLALLLGLTLAAVAFAPAPAWANTVATGFSGPPGVAYPRSISGVRAGVPGPEQLLAGHGTAPAMLGFLVVSPPHASSRELRAPLLQPDGDMLARATVPSMSGSFGAAGAACPPPGVAGADDDFDPCEFSPLARRMMKLFVILSREGLGTQQ